MTVGLSAYDMAAADVVDLAVAADEVGFDTLWLGEHILRPAQYRSEHPTHGTTAHEHHAGPIVDTTTELVDPLVTLAAAAARTTRLRLATGIYLLPLRHPILTARAAATLHDLSTGRFVLGVGAGWLREEFDALGVPFAGRGAALADALPLMRAAWRGEPFVHRGETYQLTTRPTPVEVALGGNSEPALARAASLGDAWFASGTPSLAEGVALVATLRDLRRSLGYDHPFRHHVRVSHADPELIADYRAAGLDDVVVWADQVWQGDTLDDRRASLRHHARRLGLTPR